jgi:hypothetical protein
MLQAAGGGGLGGRPLGAHIPHAGRGRVTDHARRVRLQRRRGGDCGDARQTRGCMFPQLLRLHQGLHATRQGAELV